MMTREEAKEILQGSRITSFRPNGTARAKEALNMAIEALSAEARPTQARNCDRCDIFTMAEELAKASIDACADEIVRQVKDSRVECKDCKHHHTSEMYDCCDLIAVKGRRQRAVEYCSLGERKGGDSE